MADAMPKGGSGDVSRKVAPAEPKPEPATTTTTTASATTVTTTITITEPIAAATASAKARPFDTARQWLAAVPEANAPILLRLAFHDAGTYDAVSRTGGPNGSIRLLEELKRDDNKGIEIAINICETIKGHCDNLHGKETISYADLYQLAGVVAVERTGGPKIVFVEGRKDSNEPAPSDRLPKAKINGGLDEMASHLRHVFYRMGFDDREIVALSGAHTLGSAHFNRSEFEGKFTENNLEFDNSYFGNLLQDAVEKTSTNGQGQGASTATILLPSDRCLVRDPKFLKYVQLYAKDKDAFFNDYAQAHKKMSELGFRQFPQAIPFGQKHNKKMMPSIYIAIVVTIVAAFLGYIYEAMKT